LFVPHQRVRQREVGLDKSRPIVAPKRVLHSLLMVLHDLRLELPKLFGDRHGKFEIVEVFGAVHRDFQLRDGARTITVFEHRFSVLASQ
jgi:hypothetical protein